MNILASLARPAVLASLLAASVAVNLFLGGVMAGRVGAFAMRPPPFERGFESSMRSLPEAHRREMRQHMLPALPAMREHHQKMRELHEALATELAMQNPDRATLETQLAALRTEAGAMQAVLHASFVDAALKLSPAERKQMMDVMISGPGPGGPRGPRHHPGPPGFGPPGGMPPPPPDGP